MTRRPWRTLTAVGVALVLLLAACSSDDDSGDDNGDGGGSETEERTASDTGVTADTIQIGVGVADLDGLRAGGISLPDALTTDNLSSRVTSYFDDWNAAGGINDRMIEPVVLTWDPVDPASQDQFCADATIDNELFAMIVPTGLNARTVQCLLDAGMLTFFGEFAGQEAHDSELLITIAPPVEVGARAGSEAALESGEVADGAKVGILAGNGPEAVAAAAESKAIFDDAGIDAQVLEINTLQGDIGAVNQESGAAAGTFRAAGVTNVMLLLPFTNQSGFYEAAGDDFTVTVLDTASANCTPFGASRAPAGAVGTNCITVWDNQNTAAGGIREETDFEVECRAHYDEVFAEEYPAPSSPGVPSGQVIETVDGETLTSDYDAFACTLSNIVQGALEGGGTNPTRDSVYGAALGLGEVPVALASDGQGELAEGKSFASSYVHPVVLTAVAEGTPRAADGTFDKCPAPVNCWVPTSDEWFAIES